MTTDVSKLKGEYYEAVGRRKSSTARVRVWESNKEDEIIVNGKPLDEYFPTGIQRETVQKPLDVAPIEKNFIISILVNGGGLSAQAQAARHGLSRVLVELNEDARGPLKKAGFLKRDPRQKERKKFGLKKARRAPQWSKR